MSKHQSLKPCRSKISAKGVKKALTAFIGTCGAATLMTLATSGTELKGQPVGAPGGIGVVRPTSQPASSPSATSRPTGAETKPAVLMGKPMQIRIEATN